jgi:hypothetical protein
VHVDLFVDDETLVETITTPTPTPLASKSTLIKLQHTAKMKDITEPEKVGIKLLFE